MDPDGVARAFVDHYYTTFDTNRAALVGLYQEGSMLTFEGDKFMGAAAITQKLTSLPFAACKHQVTTVDCQPSGAGGGMLVLSPAHCRSARVSTPSSSLRCSI